MGKFFRGVIFGVGLSVLLAPVSGRDMRQLLTKRIQKLRGHLPDNEQLLHIPAQVSNYTDKTSHTLKNAISQVKESASQRSAEAQPTEPKNAQTYTPESNATLSEQLPFPASTTYAAPPIDMSSLTGSLQTIPGMEPEIQKALEAQGISTLQQLLERTPTKQERTDLAHKVGVNARRLKTLADRADLMRLPGVNGDIATMFEEAGVNGCKDLQHRNPEHLHGILTELYANKQIALPPPELEQLMQWIAEATGVIVTEHA